MDKVISFFLPESDKDADVFELRKRKLFISFSFLAFAALLIFTLTHLGTNRYYTAMINFGGMFLFLTSLCIYKHTGRYRLAAATFFGSSQLLLGVHHAIAPALLTVNLMWLPVLCLIAYFVMPRMYARVNLISCIVVTSLAHFLNIHYIFKLDHFSQNDINTISFTTIILCLTVSYLIGRRIATEDINVHSELEDKNKQLLELSEQDAALVAILSHDLANHLQIATSYSKKIARLNTSSELNDVIKRVQKACKSMGEIVDEVRNIKASQTGKLKIDLFRTNVIESLEEAIEMHFEKAKAKNISIVKDYKINDESITIMAEPTSLTNTIFSNIISNAIKFSHENSKIEVKVTDSENKVLISIRDYGIGIPLDLQKNLFSQNVPTSRNGTKGEKGTGLGMLVLSTFVERFNGELALFSRTRGSNKGSEFSLVFHKVEEDQKDVAA